MPPKRSAIGRSTPRARQAKKTRSNETVSQRNNRNESNRLHTAQSRISETDEQREVRQESNRVRTFVSRSNETITQSVNRNENNRLRTAQSRASETDEQRESRQESNRVSTSRSRSNETVTQRVNRNENNRLRTAQSRQTLHVDMKNAAFNYNANYNYSQHPSVDIGKMENVCVHCGAFKFKNETPGMCCANGKVTLPPLRPPIEPLLSLLKCETPDSKHFLKNIRKYNSSFQMTSFGATKIVTDNFMPTFKIQRQIYHRVGSLLPVPDAEHKFLQIYFIGDDNLQADQRCHSIPGTKRTVILSLQTFLQENNALVKLFKTAIEQMPSDDHTIAIRADKTPAGEHARRFNSPTMDDVAILIVGERFEARDIIIQRRNDNIQRVAETHRSYDALQYPLIFWDGQDGYHFNIMQTNPNTGKCYYHFIYKQ